MANLQEPWQIAGFASTPRRWKPYPAYKPSGVDWLGAIPAHWEVKRLKYVAPICDERAYAVEPEARYIGLEHIESATGRLAESASDGSQNGAATEGTAAVFRTGDVLFGKLRPYLSKVFEAGFDGVCSTELLVMRPTPEITSRFLAYTLLSKEFITWVDSMTYGTKMPRASPEQVTNTEAPLPPVTEQRAIVAFLDREMAKIDALVGKKEQLIELLQEKRSVLITDAVTKSVRPSAHMKDPRVGWISEIPAHWDMRRLKFATSFVTSGSRGWAQHYSDEGAIFLRIGNLSRTGIELQLDDVQYVDPPAGAEGRRTKVEPGDLLVSITAYIGSVGVAPEGIGEAYVNQHLALARLRREVVEPRWAAYCLLSHVGQPQLRLLLYGGTKDGLGLDDVKALELLVPPLAEQSAIVRAIDKDVARIDELVAKVRDGIRQLKEYRVAVISAAVTGRIDVRGEVAS